ncbi:MULTISPECIES: Eco57I restriction-modification methylase domain-containing protein [unclassified Tolypothrix]|uniref:Eco57I restriction-modification methylase domain-containing protein n=1 Tax=unclassified Tolypothrix TaxID=2649714 RepID=UPI0005EAC72C|nr:MULTISPECIES: DNA methyltransferase [unclassified Tolypothrix]BAY91162.1 putative transcriptional regulator [Microchaete diplosiphon NIES-3275]EKE99907.1 typeII site-specific deoxyribonuclease [Tolypothrix sp. PCC 7601]MBE9081397.1 Eco57I restriction-modification methylase domain-containing protein [Tolypothrix sp. LEGE 11397]UYD25250.1 Eco57I restriction-modification methylase domain-containing protein [Tolypothrix sp. PCC 7712]UYD32511.1 Eco57I restriction-modification methylase domain-co
MTLNFQQTRELLHNFQFQDLFIQQLGWSDSSQKKAVTLEIEEKTYQYQRIAESSGVAIFEVTAAEGNIPDAKIRAAIHKEVTNLIAENLLIFIDGQRTRSLWYWVKREENKSYIREPLYVKGQPGDLFLSKLGSLVIDITELEDDNLSVVEIARRLQDAFDVEPVTKKFYKEFQEEHKQFLQHIKGIDNEADKRWYASVILNRMMFVYFLQRKSFLDNGDLNYLQNRLNQSKDKGENLFYSSFLKVLFFDSFATPEEDRDPSVEKLVGVIKYLNGGLFLQHRIEQENNISIPDIAFEKVLELFAKYSWNLDDTPEGKDDEISPDVLGYIFEKYINQKAFGAYYTRPQITEYLCDRTIHKLILDRVNDSLSDKYRPFEDYNELIFKLDANICRLLINDILPKLSILDPACGSGAFLVAAMKTLILVYGAVIGMIDVIGDANLKQQIQDIRDKHQSISYYLKKRIVTDNLYGVDIMEEATEIAKLRLFLALVSSAHDVNQLEPLPNIDFNIMAGNSLIGLMKVDATVFDKVQLTAKAKARGYKQENPDLQLSLFQSSSYYTYQSILEEKNKSIELYKKHAFIPGKEKVAGLDDGTHQDKRLLLLRASIDNINNKSQEKLNVLLLDEFSTRLGIKYEEVQLTGKPKKRVLNVDDIAALKPFHWGYHFDKVLGRGGFDAIITNPPWEIFKPQAKEFFAQHNELVTKNKMDIKVFEKEQKRLLENPEVAAAWLEYQSQYPHVSAYFRSSEQYKNQISVVNGKKAGTDINLYKLFLEQCFNLLRPNGECGIVIPSGIYTDLGAKQLREMLFNQTNITGLFCFENRKTIFEEVDSRFKFVVLTFVKGGKTTEFPSAFMRHDVQELQRFPSDESLPITIDMVRKLSPDSLSVMEFKNEVDVRIAEKMLKFPLLGEKIDHKWNLRLTREFDMTNDSYLFKQQPGKGRLPLYEGKMIHQFTHQFAEPRYWVDEQEGRQAALGRNRKDEGQNLDYQNYRLGFRDVARNTDIRTMIAGIIPPKVFAGNTLVLSQPLTNQKELLFACAVLNSFACDFVIRQKVTAHCNMFYVYQLPVPRLTKSDRTFADIVQRAAKLICTTPEFDELAQEVGLGSHTKVVTDESERAKLRAELDGIIAHLYGLTEAEFAYILTTFPIVPEQVKQDALTAYRDFAPLTGDADIVELITT